MIKDIWTINDYEEFIKYLYSLQDLKYREFHKKLIVSDDLIGIRTPQLKKIARSISKGNYKSFFEVQKLELYEEKIIRGFIIGYIDNPIAEFNKFVPYMDNWAICDLTVSNMKWFKNNKDLDLIDKYINKRVGYVILLNYFIDIKYLDYIYDYCDRSNTQEYYVKMAISWLLSICYINYKEETLSYLKRAKIDKFIYNKTLQKIIESNKISKEEKDCLRKMKK